MQNVDVKRLESAKRAASTRRIDLELGTRLIAKGVAPAAGDLVLARVDRTGHHDGVEQASGRRATLYPRDEILLCYGNRYAPDQFEAVVPADLGACHMVAAGGLAAKALSWHTRIRPPTEITPIGLVANSDGKPLNIRSFRLPTPALHLSIPVILSVGTSMNSGKTTTAAQLIRALRLAGIDVGAAKITGTSAGKDPWLMSDAGARMVLDFNDAGFATTYMEPVTDVENGAFTLLKTLQAGGCRMAVVEIADGLLQQETRELLARPGFKRCVSAVFFSAVDSMGAVAGASWLGQQGYYVASLAGVMTNSPLAAREAALASGLPVRLLRELQEPSQVLPLLPFAPVTMRNSHLEDIEHAAAAGA